MLKGHDMMQLRIEVTYTQIFKTYFSPSSPQTILLILHWSISFLMVQLMTNDTFISVYHRVLSRHIGPRISVVSFFMNFTMSKCTSKVYGPIKALLSEEKPPMYRDITMTDFLAHYYSKGLDGKSCLLPFRIWIKFK